MHDLEKKQIILQSNKHAWKAEFEQRYCQPGQEDEFGWNLSTLKKAEFFSRFLYEDWFKAITLGVEIFQPKVQWYWSEIILEFYP